MSIYQTDSRIDDYIVTLPAWQQDICLRVRDLVHAADPDVTETIKRTRQPYFVLEGNICALLAARDHVNVLAGLVLVDFLSASSSRYARRSSPPDCALFTAWARERSSGTGARRG